jgi:hypothetical protein
MAVVGDRLLETLPYGFVVHATSIGFGR